MIVYNHLRRRLLHVFGVILACLLVATPVTWAGVAAPRSFDGGVLLPDNDGAITELVVHFAPEMEYELAPMLRDLFAALPDDTRLLVLCPSYESAEHFINEWGIAAVGGGREVHVINVDVDISIWARDRRFSRYDPANGAPASTFVPAPFQDYEFWQLNEMMLPFLLGATGLSPKAFTAPLRIEGGNAVTSSTRLFTGTNVFVDNNDADHPPAEIVGEIEEMFGITPILVGDADGAVPWCHVDMYLTPVDDNTILVASPVLATKLLAWSSLNPDDCPEDDVCIADAAEEAPEYQDRFDRVADQLRRQGFRVLRLPAVVDESDDWMLTYNNVLMEERDGHRIVYMPIYHIQMLDVAAAAVFGSLGFEVRPIDVSRLFQWGGAIRCTVNVTSRRPHNAPAPPTIVPAGHIVLIDLAAESDSAIQLYPVPDRPATSPRLPARMRSIN